MKIPNKILKIWKKEIEPADLEEIQNIHRVSPSTVRRSILLGTCQRRTMDAVNHYILVKRSKQAQIVKSLTDQDVD